MHDDRRIVEARLARVVRERIARAVVSHRHPMEVTYWEAPGEPPSPAEATAATYEPFVMGSPWGRPWGTTWFRCAATVPSEWAGRAVDAEIDLGFSGMAGFQCEGLIWRHRDADDPASPLEPYRGVHPQNLRVPVTPKGDGQQLDWWLEAASNPVLVDHRPDPNSDLPTAGTGPIYTFRRADLVIVDQNVHGLREDIRALAGLMRHLPEDQPRHHEILRGLEAMLDRLVVDDVAGSAAAAREPLAELLAQPAAASAHRISAIGHAHIDSAWLWPIRETKRKCARTFSNVVELMDEYPELMFGCSQAVQYEWMRTEYPSVFEKVRQRIAEGRWVPIGGMWVEADTNLAGGEALVRQIVYGQRFFVEQFGVECTEVWIPDVFGYPASLPGIMRIAGIDRFLTQKLSWNTTNRFPHHSFIWEGIDGSDVFTHFPPVETYNATFDARELAHAVRTFNDKGRATRSLMPFGWGDGGGGPTPKMLEQFRRVRDLDGSPRIEIESPEAFFDAAIEEYADPPRWVGELYFEMHRGTYTSQAKTKAGNRRCEELLFEAELWSATAYDADEYPAEELEECWKEVLLLQFHDILPGSSIGWVHREAEATYAELEARLETIIGGALGRLAGDLGGPVHANAASSARAEVAVFEAPAADTADADAPDSSADHTQLLDDGRVARWVEVGAASVAGPTDPPAPPARSAPVRTDIAPGGTHVLDNGLVRVVVDDRGLLISVFDVAADRELLVAGQPGNLLQLHPDHPNEYDAWDLDDFYRRQVLDLVECDSVEVVDEGPLVAAVEVSRSFGSSTIRQRIELRAGSPRVDITSDVDWQENERVLKAAFPLDIHTAEVTREVQFGHYRSAVHTNTSWDQARFEVCAHRWIDVSEPGCGVAILNDSKYGHDVTRARYGESPNETTGVVARVTLLRAPNYPDPVADRGRHRFRYSLLPHRGDLEHADITGEADRLSHPVRQVVPHGEGSSATDVDATTTERSLPAVVGFADPDLEESNAVSQVAIDAVKLADDGSGDLVVRCHEAWGGRASAELVVGDTDRFDPSSIYATSVHEVVDPRVPDVSIEHADTGSPVVALRPFQVATLRIARRN